MHCAPACNSAAVPKSFVTFDVSAERHFANYAIAWFSSRMISNESRLFIRVFVLNFSVTRGLFGVQGPWYYDGFIMVIVTEVRYNTTTVVVYKNVVIIELILFMYINVE